VIGVVEPSDAGLVVAVTDPAGLVLAGQPVAPSVSAPFTSPPPISPGDPQTSPAGVANRAGNLEGFPAIGVTVAGLAMILAMTLLSGAVTGLRRARAQRLAAARIAARVGALAGQPPDASTPRSAEREPSTIHSA
jgi:hypothetical protein